MARKTQATNPRRDLPDRSFRDIVVRGLFLLLAAVAAPSGPAFAATSDEARSEALSARLITAQNGIAPDTRSISAGLDLKLEDGWKTYWRSPGEVGFAPEIDWQASENVAGVTLQWPAPERFTAFGIENIGYHDEVVFPLLVELDRPGEPATLSAEVELLVCSDICVPQTFPLSLDLPLVDGFDQGSADRIAAFTARVPQPAEATDAVAHSDADATTLTVAVTRDAPFSDPDVFPEFDRNVAFGKPDIRLSPDGRTLWARLDMRGAEDLGALPRLTVTDGPGNALTLAPASVGTPPEPPFSRASGPAPGLGALVSIALVAFLGGLVLNVMPCVLPVLSIKLSSAMKAGNRDPAAIRGGFLSAAAGVMAFMWALAATLFALQQAGAAVGWGLQFQNPVFLALVFVVLAAFAANMFGAFEVSLPSSLQTRLAGTGGRAGYGADFLTGMFGAVLATPCSAPFLGTAIAFALAGRGIDILVVFTGLGLGLALPYLAVAAMPRLVAMIPRPGRWMLWLRSVLGLLLLGTAGWLFWVLLGVAGREAALAVLALSLCLVALLSWSRLAPTMRWTGVAIFAALPLFAAGTLAETGARETLARSAIPWAAFDRAEIARHVSRGETVFVDVTADWCLTCIANKTLVLERDPVRDTLSEDGIVAMQADWTRPDESISHYLESFGRYGIPFNVVYGPDAPDGIVLSEVLSGDAVLAAIDRAGGTTRQAGAR